MPELTKSLIDALPLPTTDKVSYVWDNHLKGFGLRLYPSGRKSFVFSYYAEYQKRIMVLGSYGKLTPENARKLAIRHAAEVIDGKDPLGERKGARAEPIIKELVQDFLTKYAEPHCAPKTLESYRRHLELFLLSHFSKPYGWQ